MIERLKKNRVIRFLLYPYIWVKLKFLRRADAKFESDFDTFYGRVREPLSIELSEFSGVFEVPPDSHLLRMIIREGGYEPDLLPKIREQIKIPGDFIDIGANIGLFSVLFSKSKTDGKVLAVEPTKAAFQRLTRNLQTNNCDNVITFQGALGKEVGEVKMHTIPGREEYSSLEPIKHINAAASPSVTEIVKMETLDNLVKRHNLKPSFIKVDVEGAELEVLSGALETLEKFRPTMVCELDSKLLGGFGKTVRDARLFFESLNYGIFDARTGGPAMGGLGDAVLVVPK